MAGHVREHTQRFGVDIRVRRDRNQCEYHTHSRRTTHGCEDTLPRIVRVPYLHMTSKHSAPVAPHNSHHIRVANPRSPVLTVPRRIDTPDSEK